MDETVEQLFAANLELESFRPGFSATDVDGLVDFYCEAFGFRVISSWRGFALLRGGGAELSIRFAEKPHPQEAYLYVRGIEGALNRVRLHGAEVLRPLSQQPWGLVDFVFRDPAGNLVGVGERRES